MITEDYVSFEVAKLLKEKGFDSDEYEVHYDTYNHQEYKITLQMALKWLREIYNIYLNINIRIILEQWSGYDISVYTTDNNEFLNKNISINLKDNTSYEKACEEVIKYCLTNLI